MTFAQIAFLLTSSLMVGAAIGFVTCALLVNSKDVRK